MTAVKKLQCKHKRIVWSNELELEFTPCLVQEVHGLPDKKNINFMFY